MEKDEKCKCPDGPCGHVWDGPTKQLTNIDKNGNEYVCGETGTCSKCGLEQITHDILCGP